MPSATLPITTVSCVPRRSILILLRGDGWLLPVSRNASLLKARAKRPANPVHSQPLPPPDSIEGGRLPSKIACKPSR